MSLQGNGWGDEVEYLCITQCISVLEYIFAFIHTIGGWHSVYMCIILCLFCLICSLLMNTWLYLCKSYDVPSNYHPSHCPRCRECPQSGTHSPPQYPAYSPDRSRLVGPPWGYILGHWPLLPGGSGLGTLFVSLEILRLEEEDRVWLPCNMQWLSRTERIRWRLDKTMCHFIGLLTSFYLGRHGDTTV